MTTSLDFTPRCFEHSVDLWPANFGDLRDSTDALPHIPELHHRMQTDGYLYLPGLLNREDVLAARREVCSRLFTHGYLHPSLDPMLGVIAPDKRNAFMPDVVARGNAPLMQALYGGPMMAFWHAFLGGDVRHFDYTWFRTVFPGHGTASHCDIVYMGRGTPNLYTAWTPIGDIDLELGGLMILEGSNNHAKLRSSYCTMDVDAYCANKEGPAGMDAWQKGTGGWLGKDPNQIRRSIGGRWLTREHFHAGDVILFSVFTVHAGLDNQTHDRVRLSSDTRYQLASEPADERWIGENPIGHGPAGKKTLIC